MQDEDIIQILNEWNFWNKQIESGVIREELLSKLIRYSKNDEIIAISGVRRSGKSTIILQLLDYLIKNGIPKENTLYINFEDTNFHNFLSLEFLNNLFKAYKRILNPKGRIYLVLDEIQKVKGWETFARTIYDKKENVKIFVTGSSSELLSSELSTLITGRHLEIEVFPLSFKEYLYFNNVDISSKNSIIFKKEDIVNTFNNYLKESSFPKIFFLKDTQTKKELLQQYFNDILTKDVVVRYSIKDFDKLKTLALYYSSNFTKYVSYNKIKRFLSKELSIDTIERFSAYLEKPYLLFFLKRFSYNLKVQEKAERKVYIIDNGLNESISFKLSENKGKLLENLVFLELRREKAEFYYYKTKNGLEVDFIVKEGQKIQKLIQVSYSVKDLKTKEREVKSLLKAMEEQKLDKGLILTFEEEEILVFGKKSITFMPVWKWLLSLSLKQPLN